MARLVIRDTYPIRLLAYLLLAFRVLRWRFRVLYIGVLSLYHRVRTSRIQVREGGYSCLILTICRLLKVDLNAVLVMRLWGRVSDCSAGVPTGLRLQA